MSPATTGALRAEGLTKQFGQLRAVDHLDLEVPRGERVSSSDGRISLRNAPTVAAFSRSKSE